METRVAMTKSAKPAASIAAIDACLSLALLDAAAAYGRPASPRRRSVRGLAVHSLLVVALGCGGSSSTPPIVGEPTDGAAAEAGSGGSVAGGSDAGDASAAGIGGDRIAGSYSGSFVDNHAGPGGAVLMTFPGDGTVTMISGPGDNGDGSVIGTVDAVGNVHLESLDQDNCTWTVTGLVTLESGHYRARGTWGNRVTGGTCSPRTSDGTWVATKQ
jgi:hypothetical protein